VYRLFKADAQDVWSQRLKQPLGLRLIRILLVVQLHW
jgi:hypothetical protein